MPELQYTPLTKSYKNAYPFKLATTSFIYQDDYIPNVRMLGSYVDEVELLMFESAWPDSLPSSKTVQALKNLGNEMGLAYNIHLPTDISLSSPDKTLMNRSADVLQRFIEQTAPLSPSTFTLHLPFNMDSYDKDSVKAWQNMAYEGMRKLLSSGLKSHMISVETLDYPFEWAKPLIDDLNLSVCMDMGHLMLYDFDVKTFFNEFSDKISIIHLHGVRDGKDHISLDNLSKENTESVIEILRRYTGVVSLEVFSYKHLVPSLEFLEKEWKTEKIK